MNQKKRKVKLKNSEVVMYLFHYFEVTCSASETCVFTQILKFWHSSCRGNKTANLTTLVGVDSHCDAKQPEQIQV